MLSRQHRLLFVTPLVLVLIPFLLWPALFAFFASFTNYVPLHTISLRFVGLINYLNILRDVDFQASVRNVVIFTVMTVLAELSIGTAIAYALRKPFRGRGIVRFILFLPWLISPIANGVMWHYLFNTETGLINYGPALLGLPRPPAPLCPGFALAAAMAVDVWRKVPLVSFLALPGLLAIPAVAWDQADLEGLSLFLRVRHVLLPRLRLLILTITLLLVGDALGTSDSILILTGGGPASETITPGLYSYRQALEAFDWKTGATSAWLIAAAILLVGVCYVLLARRGANQ